MGQAQGWSMRIEEIPQTRLGLCQWEVGQKVRGSPGWREVWPQANIAKLFLSLSRRETGSDLESHRATQLGSEVFRPQVSLSPPLDLYFSPC